MQAAKTLRIVVVGVGLAAWAAPVPAEPPAGAPAVAAQTTATTGERDRVVGTYRMVGRRVKSEAGRWSDVAGFDSIGYITYSDRGYMGVHVMPNGRATFAGDGPTPDEALAALDGYAAYYGPFSTHQDEDGRYLIHHRAGQIDPGGEVDAKRYYDIDGDRLVLTPAAADGSKRNATRQVLWERVPDVPLSAEARRFVGVRQLLYTERYTVRDGEPVPHDGRNESRAGSYIIYTPSGHMMVHLMAREGRSPYAGTAPTPAEALAAYRSYGGYFGRFTVHEDATPAYVVHHIEGRPRPAAPNDTDRLYKLDGDVLRLGGRPRSADDGSMTGGHLYWERLPVRPE